VPQDLANSSSFWRLGGVEIGGDFNGDADKEVALAMSLDIADTPAFESEGGAALGAGGQADQGFGLSASFAVEGRNFDFGAESRLREIDGYFADEIVAFALEDLVIFNVDDDIQVAGRTAALARGAIARGAELGARVDSWRDAESHRGGFVGAADAFAGAAGLFDDLAGAFAPGTRLLDAENAARDNDTSPAAALETTDGLGAFSARNHAILAGGGLCQVQLLLDA